MCSVKTGALVNGVSIVRERHVPTTFTYYHIELDSHELILAENTPAETFIDHVDRMGFDNWAEYEALYPDGRSIEEMAYPRAKAAIDKCRGRSVKDWLSGGPGSGAQRLNERL